MDPSLEADGVTPADLEAQLELRIEVTQELSDARILVVRIAEALDTADGRRAEQLQEIYRELMRAPGKYPPRMLLDQLEYLYEVITTADFMPGQDAFDRYRGTTNRARESHRIGAAAHRRLPEVLPHSLVPASAA